MYISIPVNAIRVVESVMRDHNMIPTEVKLPVVGGVQEVNIRDDQVARNVIHRLKAAGVTPTFISGA